jgi:AcrR family transcriptional regulator
MADPANSPTARERDDAALHQRTQGDSRTAILDAAEVLFASKGYAATTVKQIAVKAVRNTALIHYYFETKEKLYKEVLRRVVTHLVEVTSIALISAPNPEQSIRSVVRAQLSVLRMHPHVHQLIVREMADWGAAHAEDAIHTLAATIFRRFCDFIAAGQREGRFRQDVDPRYVTISILSQLNWVFVAKPAVGVFLGRGLGGLTDADVDAFADHIADFALAALRPITPRGGSAPRSAPHENPRRSGGPAGAADSRGEE